MKFLFIYTSSRKKINSAKMKRIVKYILTREYKPIYTQRERKQLWEFWIKIKKDLIKAVRDFCFLLMPLFRSYLNARPCYYEETNNLANQITLYLAKGKKNINKV